MATCNCSTHSFNSSTAQVAKYKQTSNNPRKLMNFQDSWKPHNTRINPLITMPEQHPHSSYAMYNMAFNNNYTKPVHYHHSSHYSFRNPSIVSFPGNLS